MMKYGTVFLICFIVPEILPCYGIDSQWLPRPKFRNYKSVLEDVMNSFQVFLDLDFAKEDDLLIDLVTSIEVDKNCLICTDIKSPGYKNVVVRKKSKKVKFGGKTKIPKLFLVNDSQHPGHSLRANKVASKLVPKDSPPHASSDSPNTARNHAKPKDSLPHTSIDSPNPSRNYASEHKLKDLPPRSLSDSPDNLSRRKHKTVKKSMFRGSLHKTRKDDTLKKKVGNPKKEVNPWKIADLLFALLVVCCFMIISIRIMMRRKKETTITLHTSSGEPPGCAEKPNKVGPGQQKTVTLHTFCEPPGYADETPKKVGSGETTINLYAYCNSGCPKMNLYAYCKSGCAEKTKKVGPDDESEIPEKPKINDPESPESRSYCETEHQSQTLSVSTISGGQKASTVGPPPSAKPASQRNPLLVFI